MSSSTREKQVGIRLRAKDLVRVKNLCEKFEEKASSIIRRAIREMAIREGAEPKNGKR
jgi:hypothetical protein